MIIHDIEQGTNEWHQLRAGIPTASEFSKLVTSTGQPSKSLEDYAMVLAAEKYAGKAVDGWEGNRYTDRGKELEDEARVDYELVNQVEVQQVGFITNDLKQYGCSPDGLVGSTGAVQLKCQIAKEHIKSYLYFKKHHKAPTKFIPQTQGELYVCERRWVDLVFYHPDLPSFTIRQKPNPVLVEALKAQLTEVEARRNIILATLKTM